MEENSVIKNNGICGLISNTMLSFVQLETDNTSTSDLLTTQFLDFWSWRKFTGFKVKSEISPLLLKKANHSAGCMWRDFVLVFFLCILFTILRKHFKNEQTLNIIRVQMSIIHLLSKCYWKLKNKDTKMIETSPCCHIAYNITEELKKKKNNQG